MKLFLCLILIGVLFSGCEDIHKKHVVGSYFLTSVDGDPLSLSYDMNDGDFLGVVPEAEKVGYNDQYIIVKQHRWHSTVSSRVYFIIPLNRNKFPDENKIGPLNEFEFKNETRKLGIYDSIRFSIDVNDM